MNEYLLRKRLNQLTLNGHLTEDTNKILFKEYQEDVLNNKEKEESEARTLLIMGNRRLIYYVLKKEFGIISSCDDTEEASVGNIGLVKAVDTYNPDSGFKFNTYAYRVISNEIHVYHRTVNKKLNIIERTKISLDDYVPSLSSMDDEQLTFGDMVSDDENFVAEVQDMQLFEDIVKKMRYLQNKEIFAIVHYFGLFGKNPSTQQEISKKLKISRSNVGRYLAIGLEKLKVLSLSEECLTEEQIILKYKLLSTGPKCELENVF